MTRIHHILRNFDLSYEYGPCVGVDRMARWKRAQTLGLDPPSEVCCARQPVTKTSALTTF